MPNKNTPNGFYMFMLEEQKKIKAQTKRAPSMHEMPAICKDTWRSLSAAEKAHYDGLAKQEKSRQRGGSEKDKYRKDNLRQIIAYRRDPVVEKEKRRRHETETMMKSWMDSDLLDIVFRVIDFQVMYDERRENHHLPLELGMVAFTLRGGIHKFFHTFINPGDVPQGNRHLAFKHSENTHQIPVDFEQGDKNYKGIWESITNFIGENDSDSDDIPPLFCLSDHTEIVESCLDFLHAMSGVDEPFFLHKIYCMEDLVASLMMKSGKTERRPVNSQIHDALRQNIWDYTSSIRCSYHEETDCSYCSLSIVRRYCFAAFDLLSGVLDFSLTKNHMPEQTQPLFTVHPPEAFGRAFNRGNQRRDFDRPRMREDSHSPPAFRTPEPLQQQQQQQHQPAQRSSFTAMPPPRARAPPPIGRFEIRLSDDESSEDDDDDDDDVLHTTEVKSTSDQYHLKELRKPKAPSMLQAASAGGDNVRPGLANLGRGMFLNMRAQAPSAASVAPPPGFSRMPIMPTATQGPPAQSFGRGATVAQMSSVVGRGRGRGRGLPPQI
ncbi:protein maelstrom homolog [Plakobranchus ocellatus]|uniref:Protein maelstrom homolog n=1 Tax=Plakobranchus ocellatus TaxID=259542 RepID=A0AAV4BSQ7_9GAST|nr:protein maelstrom homolog [Plakobranchus ocellatus]